jgi:hypothetical protein
MIAPRVDPSREQRVEVIDAAFRHLSVAPPPPTKDLSERARASRLPFVDGLAIT